MYTYPPRGSFSALNVTESSRQSLVSPVTCGHTPGDDMGRHCRIRRGGQHHDLNIKFVIWICTRCLISPTYILRMNFILNIKALILCQIIQAILGQISLASPYSNEIQYWENRIWLNHERFQIQYFIEKVEAEIIETSREFK